VSKRPASEASQIPSTEALTETGKRNEDRVKAGVMLAGEDLRESAYGKKVRFDGKKRTTIAGLWLWQVRPMDEALEWIRCSLFCEGEVELRPIFGPDDFVASDPTS